MRYIYEHEQIDSIAGLSFKFLICNVQHNPLHWHEEIELVYCVKGTLKLKTLKRTMTMLSGDIVLMNKNSVHQVLGEDKENVAIVLQFNFDHIKKYISNEKEYYFQCNSVFVKNGDYSKLKSLIFDLVGALAEKKEGYLLEIVAVRNYLVLELLNSFVCQEENLKAETENNSTIERLSMIIKYIENNYSNNISLRKIAEDHFLSSYYLSHYFQQKMGITFRKYLTYIRVYHARETLINSNDRIIDIALNCGFASIQSFSKAFKTEFGKAPGKYRKEWLANQRLQKNETAISGHTWSSINPEDVYGLLQGLQ